MLVYFIYISINHVLWTMCCGLCVVDYVLWTMYYGLCVVDYVLWTMCCGLCIMDCVVDYVLWTMCCGLCIMDYVLRTMCYGHVYYEFTKVVHAWSLFSVNYGISLISTADTESDLDDYCFV